MQVKTVHRTSGIIIAVFTGLHLFNHLCSIAGAEKHIEMMTLLRKMYRNIFAETILLASILVQIASGIKLFRAKRLYAKTAFEKLQIWTGLYLAFFLVIHLAAVLAARQFLQLDTNFYFGVAGINTFPFTLFFIPYYGLAVFSVFGHIAAVHSQKMRWPVFGITPATQGKIILVVGVLLTLILFYGFTNGFRGVEIPGSYAIPGSFI